MIRRYTLELGRTSRRTLLMGSVAALCRSALAQDGRVALTAGEVIDRIKMHVGVDWSDRTVDNIIAGRPETPVKGIATTMMATLDVVQRAAAAGKNLVITHESTFFSHRDDVEKLTEDETYQYKLDFLRRNEMVVFHFHDHWHRRRPDGIAVGMAREAGWEEYMDPDNPKLFEMPPTTLGELAADLQERLGASTMRVLGDPELPVKRVLASWGYVSQFPGTPFFARPDIDLFICGETREWELVEYAQDAITSGKKKGLILVGHIASEQAGMKYCAEWLKTFVNEVPIEFIPAGEPFWSPEGLRG